MSTEATTYPGAITVLSGETLPIGIDFTPLIATGQTPTTPTAALYDVTAVVGSGPGTPVTLTGSLTLVGNVVSQSVTGLVAGHTYRLVLGLTAAAGTIWQAGVILACPF